MDTTKAVQITEKHDFLLIRNHHQKPNETQRFGNLEGSGTLTV
ncbi:MAG: hypothetical protein OXL96_18915 [Candidatus Poribacteria bacterium]|nr:hypothetical protein [Candidatus Poribacteria bacterium]